MNRQCAATQSVYHTLMSPNMTEFSEHPTLVYTLLSQLKQLLIQSISVCYE